MKPYLVGGKGLRLLVGLAGMLMLLAAACSSSATSAPAIQPTATSESVPEPTATTATQNLAASSTPVPTPAVQQPATSVPTITQLAPTEPASPTDAPPATATAVPAATREATSTPDPPVVMVIIPNPTEESEATLEPSPEPTATTVPATKEPEEAPQIEVEAGSVSLAPSKDTTLYQASSNFPSNGSGQHFFAGSTGRGLARRALLAFDVAGVIPEGATINSVVLTLNMSRTQAGAEDIALHRLLADWGEGASDAAANEGGGTAAANGDATWGHTVFDTQEWETTGGDFAAQAAGTQRVSDVGQYTWASTDEMVADVQSWLDDASTNFGWLLLGNEATTQTSKRFDSRENGTEGNRPILTVEFTPGE